MGPCGFFSRLLQSLVLVLAQMQELLRRWQAALHGRLHYMQCGTRCAPGSGGDDYGVRWGGQLPHARIHDAQRLYTLHCTRVNTGLTGHYL